MLFSSSVFLCFFGMYYLIHLLLPHNSFRYFLIIIGSTIFYAYWNPIYVWVPYVLMFIAFIGAFWVNAAEEQRNKKFRTIVSIIFLILPLVLFKYLNFIYTSVLGFEGKLTSISLPLGISFITFSLIAYLVDVYKNRYPVEKSFSNFAMYTLFFPHLIAGPILRPRELVPQLHRIGDKIRKNLLIYGTALFTFGLLKKLVFADQIGVAVDAVYQNVSGDFTGWDYLVAIYGFSVQIYCDFSGYTDMALGIALFFGIKLPHNFARPYLATSVIDFWRRWHITLSTWLRDYVYIPLGGSKKGFNKQLQNILITMALGGLWHGASWTFIIWGVCHGVAISINHIIRKHASFNWIERVPKFFRILFIFHIITFLWILFRASDITTAWQIMKGPFVGGFHLAADFFTNNAFLVALILLFFILCRWDDYRYVYLLMKKRKRDFFWPILIFIWLVAIVLGMDSSAKFVYFDF